MHGGQRVEDPLGRVRVLDVVAQVVEQVVLDVEVRLETLVGQHLLDPVMEPVGPHELVVEMEWDGKSVGHGAFREIEGSQYGDVGRLDPERGPVLEANLIKRSNLRNREVLLRRLWLRPGRLVVGIDFLLCGRAY